MQVALALTEFSVSSIGYKKVPMLPINCREQAEHQSSVNIGNFFRIADGIYNAIFSDGQ